MRNLAGRDDRLESLDSLRNRDEIDAVRVLKKEKKPWWNSFGLFKKSPPSEEALRAATALQSHAAQSHMQPQTASIESKDENAPDEAADEAETYNEQRPVSVHVKMKAAPRVSQQSGPGPELASTSNALGAFRPTAKVAPPIAPQSAPVPRMPRAFPQKMAPKMRSEACGFPDREDKTAPRSSDKMAPHRSSGVSAGEEKVPDTRTDGDDDDAELPATYPK